MPSQGGAIFLLDPLIGQATAAPYQASLAAGVQVAWQRPAVCGKQEFVIADGRNKLYRIGRADAPKPHLAVLDQIEVAAVQAAPAAVVGNTAFVADDAQTLGVYEVSPKLKRLKDHKLGGNCRWGPAALGDRVLLATDADKLFCFDAKGEKIWQAALPYGPLAASRWPPEDGYLLASAAASYGGSMRKPARSKGKWKPAAPLATGPAARAANASSAARTEASTR